MARIRPIQTGHVFQRGPSWFLQWREDVRTPAGAIERRKFTAKLAPIVTPDGREITKREAERLAHEHVLAKLNQLSVFPATLATVAEYWRRHFEPEHVAHLKAAGQAMYAWAAHRWLEHLGGLTLRELTPPAIYRALQAIIAQGSTRDHDHGAPLQPATLRLLKACLSSFCRHAIAAGYLAGANPAAAIRTPRQQPKPAAVLTFDEARAVLELLPEPTRTAAYLSMVTSLNVAELAGLVWHRVNLSAAPRMIEAGVTLPPFSLYVAQNYYLGKMDTPKTERRRRIVPLPPGLVRALADLHARTRYRAPEHYVFAGSRGGPLHAHNAAARHLAPAGLAVIGRRIGWHTFRRCAATYADYVGLPLPERIALMGHANASMTLRYTAADLDRRRPYLAAVDLQLQPAAPAAATEQGSPPHEQIPTILAC